jgi:hypothetical protein
MDTPEKWEEWVQKPLHSARKSYPCPFCTCEARLLVDLDTNFPLYNSFGHWQYQCLSCDQQFSVDLRGYVVEDPGKCTTDPHD